jgi:hypothetical protein
MAVTDGYGITPSGHTGITITDLTTVLGFIAVESASIQTSERVRIKATRQEAVSVKVIFQFHRKNKDNGRTTT